MGFRHTDTIEFESMKLRMPFAGRIGGAGLLEPPTADSPVGRFPCEAREGIHHLSFLVTDLEEALEEAEAIGPRADRPVPREGSHHTKIAFLSPGR